jgi:hypothetical protein
MAYERDEFDWIEIEDKIQKLKHVKFYYYNNSNYGLPRKN